MHKRFDVEISEIKKFGDILMSYNFPQASLADEEPVNVLKAREVCVDGYNIILHYNKADYNNYYIETLQVLGKYSPFLPFSLVCKIGKKFLGDRHLSLVELFKDNKKIYCWTLILDRDKKPVLGPFKVNNNEHLVYEGLEYRSVDPKQVNLY